MATPKQSETKQEEMKQAVVQQQQSSMVPAELPDYGDDSGAGMENVDRDETRIPFLQVLQVLSPTAKVGEPTRKPGHEPGMFMHAATQEVWPGDGSVQFVSCFKEKDYVEWVPVDSGGGFVGRYDFYDQKIVDLRKLQGRFGALELPNGNEVVQTFYLYGLLLAPNSYPRRVVLAFKSTQIKKYQNVIDIVESLKFKVNGKTKQPPLYAWKWKLSTSLEHKGKNSWFGVNLTPAGETTIKSLLPQNDPLFAMAKDFFQLLNTGGATAAREQMGSERRAEASNEVERTEDLDDEIPM